MQEHNEGKQALLTEGKHQHNWQQNKQNRNEELNHKHLDMMNNK